MLNRPKVSGYRDGNCTLNISPPPPKLHPVHGLDQGREEYPRHHRDRRFRRVQSERINSAFLAGQLRVEHGQLLRQFRGFADDDIPADTEQMG